MYKGSQFKKKWLALIISVLTQFRNNVTRRVIWVDSLLCVNEHTKGFYYDGKLLF